MAEVVAKPDPDFITYLLDPEVEHDCYFLVGNEELTTPVKIGVVRKMLMAHSQVMRRELYDSNLAEKGVISVNDLYPDTFKHLLKYVYGYNNIAMLSFEDADNLLYAAEKYLMKRLKNKLAAHLMSLLTYDNVCTLMNNPVCFRHLELDSAITQILQLETNKIFASPQFLEISPESFLKILEQDALVVKEIEVWRAALNWAKHRVNTDDGVLLRQELTPHLKQIRLCTLSLEELYDEVVPTNVLKDSECVLVCKSVALKETQDQLNEVCNSVDIRYNPILPTCLKVKFPSTEVLRSSETVLTVLTKEDGIELFPFEFRANKHSYDMAPQGLSYECSCTVTVTRITNYSNDTSTEPPITVRFNKQVKYGQQFFVPLTDNGSNIQLLPNNKYTITLVFNVEHDMYYNLIRSKFDCDHFTLKYESYKQYYITPTKQLLYRTVPSGKV